MVVPFNTSHMEMLQRLIESAVCLGHKVVEQLALHTYSILPGITTEKIDFLTQ
ncbi:hypothetical protein B0G62_108148 [Paraburkholderia eburnea]|uniref:Uncharacterized protein n=1 Tax=Paraburkholderia eburnea TaxID=1189126 RepID=A0A2S4M7D7_9BURK|nr:hypothetical protein B0G62_108148 [Paraburkholderia eburnea]PRZ21424.1 hypothetical protein BX588_109148 [Paraburkholderia eburnea]